MNIVRGFVAVIVGLAITVGFVQLLESALANAIAGRALSSLDEYAAILNSLPVLLARLAITSLIALLGGYVCAKIAMHDEMRYTVIAAIFRIIALVGGTIAGYVPPTPIWMLVVLIGLSTAAMLGGGAIRAAAAGIEARRIKEGEQL